MPFCPESVAASLHLASAVPLSSLPATEAAAARIKATVPLAAQHRAVGKIRRIIGMVTCSREGRYLGFGVATRSGRRRECKVARTGDRGRLAKCKFLREFLGDETTIDARGLEDA